MQHYQSQKHHSTEFNFVWKMLSASDKKSFLTPNGHSFVASAGRATEGVHQGKKSVLIETDGGEFACIYPCCWKHTTNCDGTYIGNYSDALIKWLDIEPGDTYVGDWE